MSDLEPPKSRELMTLTNSSSRSLSQETLELDEEVAHLHQLHETGLFNLYYTSTSTPVTLLEVSPQTEMKLMSVLEDTDFPAFHPSSSTASLPKLKRRTSSMAKMNREDLLGTQLEEVVKGCKAPQWLVYLWAYKARDKKMVDRKTQQALVEVLSLNNHCVTLALCETLPAAQHDVVAKSLLLVFQNMNSIMNPLHASSPTVETSREVNNLRISAIQTTDGENTYLIESGRSSANSLFIPPRSSEKTTADTSSYSPLSIGDKPEKKDYTILLLQALVDDEIHRNLNDEDITLFRSNNMTSKLLGAYTSNAARSYLQEILTEPVKTVLAMGPLEVDPIKLPDATPELLRANMEKLQKATTIILEALTKNQDKCPIQLRKVAFLLHNRLHKSITSVLTSDLSKRRSLTIQYSGVESFIFLRVICPVLVSADTNGIVKSLTPRDRRSLVLISKVLQNMANGVSFGVKESCMEPANEYLATNRPLLKNYCISLRNIENERVYSLSDAERIELTVKRSELETALLQLYNAIQSNFGSISTTITTKEATEVTNYTVFGALKSLMRRMHAVELLLRSSAFASSLAVLPKENDYAFNILNLSGLEEILLLNHAILFRLLVNPFSCSTLPHLKVHVIVPPGKDSSDLNTAIRASIEIIGGRSLKKLAIFVETIIKDGVRFAMEKDLNLTVSKATELLIGRGKLDMVASKILCSSIFAFSGMFARTFMLRVQELVQRTGSKDLNALARESLEIIVDSLSSFPVACKRLFQLVVDLLTEDKAMTMDEATSRLFDFIMYHFYALNFATSDGPKKHIIGRLGAMFRQHGTGRPFYHDHLDLRLIQVNLALDGIKTSDACVDDQSLDHLNISATTRTQHLLSLRQCLNASALKKMKDNLEILNLLTFSTPSPLLSNDYTISRIDTFQYRVIDRLQVVMMGILRDGQDFSKILRRASRQNSLFVADRKKSFAAVAASPTPNSERHRSGGFITANKARPSMQAILDDESRLLGPLPTPTTNVTTARGVNVLTAQVGVKSTKSPEVGKKAPEEPTAAVTHVEPNQRPKNRLSFSSRLPSFSKTSEASKHGETGVIDDDWGEEVLVEGRMPKKTGSGMKSSESLTSPRERKTLTETIKTLFRRGTNK